jgi:uncharacterized repeat protein (TIGR03803 family)
MRIIGPLFSSLITIVAAFSLAAQAQTFSVIHEFQFAVDGKAPGAGVTIRGDALYGTLLTGRSGDSTVYQIRKVGSTWVTAVLARLYKEQGSTESRAVFGPDAHLYGVNVYGGACSYGYVYQLLPPLGICKAAQCYWTENDIHSFGCPGDGAVGQSGDLVFDQAGNIYGTTAQGGDSGLGTVFELQRSGDGWTEHILYSFHSQSDGTLPVSGVIFDNSGNLYGVTTSGGTMNSGTVFELSYNGVAWTEQSIHNFDSGEEPSAGLVQDASGNFFGATEGGGSGGGGTVFELSPAGSSWNYQVLYSFSGQNDCGPWAALTLDNSGNLYGTTACEGAHNLGNVFQLTKTENGWVSSSLYDFTGGEDGAKPRGNVTIGADGTLYGTASLGGSAEGQCPLGCGTAWMITP